MGFRCAKTIITANAVGMALASLIMPAVVTNADEMWLGVSM